MADTQTGQTTDQKGGKTVMINAAGNGGSTAFVDLQEITPRNEVVATAKGALAGTALGAIPAVLYVNNKTIGKILPDLTAVLEKIIPGTRSLMRYLGFLIRRNGKAKAPPWL
jgi:hypothetical protein